MSVAIERILVLVAVIVIMLIGILIYAGLTGQLASTGYVSAFITNMLFWAPFGAITNVVTQPGQVIPA
jgi:hypothetical protein